MPRLISIMDDKRRDAQVEVEGPERREGHGWRGPDGEPVRMVRLVKGTEKTTYEALLADHGGDDQALARALVEGDPEIDGPQVGRQLVDTSRVYLGPQGNVLYVARVLKVVYDADGEEQSREDFVDVEATVGEDLPPLPWTGRLLPMDTVIRRFAFVRKLQLRHVNGLTFDFLHEIAATLQREGKLLYVGSGPKGQEPLIFQTNGTPFRGFLEGRVADDAYLLVLHLSNLEIRRFDAGE
ncbi:MAG: hypothetical protein ACFCGT_25600 [Sandaracinaceae bacterium]